MNHYIVYIGPFEVSTIQASSQDAAEKTALAKYCPHYSEHAIRVEKTEQTCVCCCQDCCNCGDQD